MSFLGSVSLGPDRLNDPTGQPYSHARIAAAATTNATSVKATSGRVYAIALANTSAAAKFVKLYNKASAPTVGTDVPLHTIALAAGQRCDLSWPAGMSFSLGIAYAITNLVADTNTDAVAANDITGGILYA